MRIRRRKTNDLFFVVGGLDYEKWFAATAEDRQLLQQDLDHAEAAIRATLANGPITIKLALEDLWIVGYSRTTLARTWFQKSLLSVDARELEQLYNSQGSKS